MLIGDDTYKTKRLHLGRIDRRDGHHRHTGGGSLAALSQSADFSGAWFS